MDQETKDHLHHELVKLGDMMGDGLHHEPDGKWISREYRKICKALGYIKPVKRDNSEVDNRMANRVKEIDCRKCGGQLKQTRSGSMRGKCKICNSKYQLMKKVKRRA